VRPPDRRPPQPGRPGLLPPAGLRGRLRRPLPRDPDDPRHLPARLRRAGAPALGRPEVRVLLGHGRARARLLGICLRGLPRRHRVRAPEPGGGGAVAWTHAGAVAALRGGAAGRPSRRAAALERLHRPAEGHRARRTDRAGGGVPAVADRGVAELRLHALPRDGAAVRPADDPARLTDYLVARERRRRLALGGAA
jgi:hypothetical protein